MSSLMLYSAGSLGICRGRQYGITIIETLLALTVASLMLVMLNQWMIAASNDLRAKRNADSLQQFSQVAGHYLDANREAIVRVMNAESVAAGTAEAQSFCVLSNDVAHPAFDPYKPSQGTHGQGTCAVDAQWLIHKKLLPDGFALTNPYGQRWVAIYRLVYADYDNNAGTPNATQFDVEMLVAATGGDPVPNTELGMTMQLMGGIAGMFPNTATPVATCASGKICGPGGWTVDVAAFEFTYN